MQKICDDEVINQLTHTPQSPLYARRNASRWYSSPLLEKCWLYVSIDSFEDFLVDQDRQFLNTPNSRVDSFRFFWTYIHPWRQLLPPYLAQPHLFKLPTLQLSRRAAHLILFQVFWTSLAPLVIRPHPQRVWGEKRISTWLHLTLTLPYQTRHQILASNYLISTLFWQAPSISLISSILSTSVKRLPVLLVVCWIPLRCLNLWYFISIWMHLQI